MNFDPIEDKFWLLKRREKSGEAAKYFSSATGCFVTSLPEGRESTKIENEVELRDVLLKAGVRAGHLPPTETSAENFVNALAIIDAKKLELAFGMSVSSILNVAQSGAIQHDDARFAEAAEAMGLRL